MSMLFLFFVHFFRILKTFFRTRSTSRTRNIISFPAGCRHTIDKTCAGWETGRWPDSRRCDSSNNSGPDRRPEVVPSLRRSITIRTCWWRNSSLTSIQQVSLYSIIGQFHHYLGTRPFRGFCGSELLFHQILWSNLILIT